MKPKKLAKRLSLSKTTVAHLGSNEQRNVKGGYYATAYFGGCYTWHPNCPSKPYDCPYTPIFCPTTEPTQTN